MPAQQRLRVIYLDHVARLSGGEIALLTTLPALLDAVEPLVVLGESGPLVDRLEAAGIDVRVVPLSDKVRDLRRSRVFSGLRLGPVISLLRHVLVLRQLMRAEHADIVHTNSLKAAVYGGLAGRLAGVPVVWHLRDRIAEDYLPPMTVRLVRFLSLFLPTVILANSRATLATLPARPLSSVLANPVIRDPARPSGAPASMSRDPGPKVGLVGRLSPWKGQDIFLRAFAEAFPAGSEVTATLIGAAMFGEDDYAASLHELAESLGIASRVTMVGFSDDVFGELDRLQLLVHCSTIPEPFGQVVLEGMSAGLCVIASAEGGPAELITDGVDGLLVPPRDPSLLASAMRRCMTDANLRARLGAAAAQTALAFTPEATASGVLAAYRSVLRAPRGRGREPLPAAER